MKAIDIFYQSEGLADIQHLEIDAGANFATVKACLIERHGVDADAFLFIEDEEEPLDEKTKVTDCISGATLKLHLNRCRKIEVAVTFNGETVNYLFAPGVTVSYVKHWAAEDKFGMSKEEASEHVLQIVGTSDRPTPGTHIGALLLCRGCDLSFDLVPDERINGA